MNSLKFSSLKSDLTEIFARHAGSMCLWLSGGADSLLLLEKLVSLEIPFGILSFDDGWTRAQKKRFSALTGKHDLQIFSYPALEHFLIAEGENIALCSRYAVGDKTNEFIVKDLVGERAFTRCAFDVRLERATRTDAPIRFDAHIRGSRFDDAHWSIEKVLAKKIRKTPECMFYSPLADWSREEVLEGLKIFGIDYAEPDEELETGNIPVCFECLIKREPFCPKEQKIIDSVKWSPDENLKRFRREISYE